MSSYTYVYHQMYGVEPYAENGGLGGAKITQDNLIITAWGDFNTDPFAFDLSKIMISSAFNDALSSAEKAASPQAYNSRHSARISIVGTPPLPLLTPPGPGPANVIPSAFVLNPPPEYKQQMVGAVKFNGGDPLLLANYTVSKSLRCNYAWGANCLFNSNSNLNILFENSSVGVQYSTYLNIPAQIGITTDHLPFLKTSGANGVAPTFFDVTTVNGVQEMIAAVNAGEFFICMVLISQNGAPTIPVNMQITYPHSAARA